MKVHQIMAAKASDRVVTIEPEARVSDAAQILAAERIGTVVVSDDGRRALGILSERDIVAELGRRGTGCLQDGVTDVMTADIVTCTRDDDADHVLRQMTDGRFRHMPVVENGTMIAMISLGDVIKARLEEVSAEKESLEEMIKGGY